LPNCKINYYCHHKQINNNQPTCNTYNCSGKRNTQLVNLSKETTSTPVNSAVDVIKHDNIHYWQIKMSLCQLKYGNAGTLTLVYDRFVLTSLRRNTNTFTRVPEDKTH